MKTKPLVLCFALLGLAFAGTAGAADATIEQALRDLDAQWSAAAAAKDVDKTVSFYSDDAVVLPPNMAAVTTKDAIRALWKGEIESATSVSWKANRVKVAKSGDMAYVSGTYEVAMTDGTKDHGKYLEVWEKMADGTWKCGADGWSSNLPAAPAEKK
jgi:ketosteroid isomerase-like protein